MESAGFIKTVVNNKAAWSVPRRISTITSIRNLQAQVKAPGLGHKVVSMCSRLERIRFHGSVGGNIGAWLIRSRGLDLDLIAHIRVDLWICWPQSPHVLERTRISIHIVFPSSTLPCSRLHRTCG